VGSERNESDLSDPRKLLLSGFAVLKPIRRILLIYEKKNTRMRRDKKGNPARVDT
jgi:hypothetical protein